MKKEEKKDETERNRKICININKVSASRVKDSSRRWTSWNIPLSTACVQNAHSRNAGDSIKAAKFSESVERITGQELRRQKAERCS